MLQVIDRVEEIRELNSIESHLRSRLRAHIFALTAEKEEKWKQRSGCTWLKLGDKNTKYFHAMANVRKNINSMETLQLDNGQAILYALMSDYLRSHFKGILGTKIQHLRPFDLSGRVGPVMMDQLQSLDNIIDEAEILRAISGIPYGKANGPNNFPIEFYQAFWATIKFDLMELIREFVKKMLISGASTKRQLP